MDKPEPAHFAREGHRAAAVETRLAAAQQVTPDPAIAPRETRTRFNVVLPTVPSEVSPGGWQGPGLRATRPPSPLGKIGPGAELEGPESAGQDVWLLLPRPPTAIPHQFWRTNGSREPTGSVPMRDP